MLGAIHVPPYALTGDSFSYVEFGTGSQIRTDTGFPPLAPKASAATISPYLHKLLIMVGLVGFEPTRPYGQQLLRLPWLPLHHRPLFGAKYQ